MENKPETVEDQPPRQTTPSRWKQWFGGKSGNESSPEAKESYRSKSTLGILSDKQTDEVPGTVLLLSHDRNEPLGLRRQPERTAASSFPQPNPPTRSPSRDPIKKTTGGVVLNPQPDDSANDPLNWPVWRRDAALLSLGFYSLLGGGMTPVLAAGFNNVAATYDVSTQQVAYTTGLYMLGLGVGSVIMSPTAILFGKRPVYLLGAFLFIISAVWCALSPNYASLVVARVFQGIAVSPVECLPSASIAEIYFLHERAYRIGIYTLLLLGGKNLVPLVSAAIINSMGWRWVFWIVAIITGGCLVCIFFFVPETFWDRTPRPHRHHKRPNLHRSVSNIISHGRRGRPSYAESLADKVEEEIQPPSPVARRHPDRHVGFANDGEKVDEHDVHDQPEGDRITAVSTAGTERAADPEKSDHPNDPEAARHATGNDSPAPVTGQAHYTNRLRERGPIPFASYLRPWPGRITHDQWHRVATRPFILFAYPAILWATAVYALSVGWLIVMSELVSHIYQGGSYNFTSLQTGLIYISPFVGGLIGTAVAGKVSDIIVKFMTRRNGGVYEPEFRLVMGIPIALSTTAGLMAFGWSAQEKDAWIVPTIFFGLVSFGCCLGSTTAITFAVDSYRQYAGEALVTLNWSKNVFHGLIFSLFVVDWMESDGARTVFLALGGIQLGCLLFTIPMYMYGKRARMWTVRKRLMEKF
ncbi:putative MFS transporter [Aspergillus glaucus CBS 516.65]|uniref:Major facilitator superfamily (MFS) profile domain-containing protein n=1 Tax=Aspergillus glaucus CBS 516.65 TaxID=1160497 RepID=A0A1L9VK69_ASPGL|nr:hypothetical protein ASPGLDRAFT_126318 [Aspergillus glaucus CBS 516.65]OJJ84292.1 hypothetical protein ASPGLDRAFT_126318 [Aspergillus glaucus CBS 516.65]